MTLAFSAAAFAACRPLTAPFSDNKSVNGVVFVRIIRFSWNQGAVSYSQQDRLGNYDI